VPKPTTVEIDELPEIDFDLELDELFGEGFKKSINDLIVLRAKDWMKDSLCLDLSIHGGGKLKIGACVVDLYEVRAYLPFMKAVEDLITNEAAESDAAEANKVRMAAKLFCDLAERILASRDESDGCE
jgi:hypothetical protein